ncbi:MAG: HAMP domain-containing protein [Steroidobacteraceae bacterium]|nr:HAMP domain-containing protein [Deltaproteobacteria bacterium]
MKNSLRKKLAAGFGLCLLLIVTVVGFNYSALGKLEKLYQETLKLSGHQELATHSQHIGKEMYQIIANALINQDLAKSDREWVACKKESLEMLSRVSKTVETPQELANVSEAEQAINDIIRIYELEMLPLIRKGATVPGPLSVVDAQLDKRITAIDLALQRVTQSMSEKNRKAAKEYHAVLKHTHGFGLVISLAGVLAVLVTISLMTRQIVGPLTEITGAALEIKKGNYLVGLKHTSHDEIGVLSDAFRDMSEQVMKRKLELQSSNERLQQEICEHRQAEEEINRLNAQLEQRVMQRTAELVNANQQCQLVLAAQKQAEEELRSSHEQLRNLSRHLQAVREEERTMIAREIHDELGQSLTALKMDVAWLGGRLPAGSAQLKEKTALMLKYIDETIKTVQRISSELRPGILDDLGLMAAIEWQAQEFQKRSGIICEVSSSFDCDTLDRCRSTALFRVVQESLTNICRHTEATLARITLEGSGNMLVASVTDNGKGISETRISDPDSLGLIGMRERARLLGGEVNISRLAEGGTSIRMTIPLDERGKEIIGMT